MPSKNALLVTSLLLLSVKHFMYTPLPAAVAEPWKLQAVCAVIRAMGAVVGVTVPL
jgi:hypothetical protein